MQRGILKHYAHVLPQIFAERVLWQDLPTLRAWGKGHLVIDIVDGSCRRYPQPRRWLPRRSRKLGVVGELHAWLAHELSKQHDPPQDLAARLEIEFSTTSAPRNVDVVFDISASLTTGDQVFVDRFNVTQSMWSLPDQVMVAHPTDERPADRG